MNKQPPETVWPRFVDTYPVAPGSTDAIGDDQAERSDAHELNAMPNPSLLAWAVMVVAVLAALSIFIPH